jgi:hypothetical protein
VHQNAWGKYRHTMAVIRSGDGNRSAVFTAEIPEAGSYDLELYLPDRDGVFFMRVIEDWHLVLETPDGPQEIDFDAAGGVGGWNSIGSYDLPEGEVKVKLTNRSEGRVVVADAVRWIPSAGTAGTENSGS